MDQTHALSSWKQKLYEIIFGAETRAGRIFDVLLILSIIISVIVVLFDSIHSFNLEYGNFFYGLEWFFTILFTIEYILRLLCVGRPVRYAVSFFGIIDLLAIIPTYLSLFLPGTQFLLVIRFLRVIRIFRILKLAQYIYEANLFLQALKSSSRKIIVFLLSIMILVSIFGSFIYLLEGEENGFTSIPRSIYWAIVTMTTVGYGDIAPKTNMGQAFSAFVMIIGFCIIAVPTGIITAEITHSVKNQKSSRRSCPECGAGNHDVDAYFCKHCGKNLLKIKD